VFLMPGGFSIENGENTFSRGARGGNFPLFTLRFRRIMKKQNAAQNEKRFLRKSYQ
jgi:hypothetical protein